MKKWQMGLIGAALIAGMTACPAPNRSGNSDPRSVFPIKGDAEWDVMFYGDNGEVLRTIGFALDGDPKYDDEGDVYADFRTTKSAASGYGYIYPKSNRFQAAFVIDPAKKLRADCYADNTPSLSSNVSGAVLENNKEISKVTCAFERR